jgi:hypothetical protein
LASLWHRGYIVGMPKRSSKSPDPNKRAFQVVREATADQPDKNPAAVALGKLGGKKGGPARAASLSPKKRKEIARKAAQARWKNNEG